MKKAAPFLCYPSLPVTYVAVRFYTCHSVSGHFTVILSLIVTMHAEEEIKTHVVASCQSKAACYQLIKERLSEHPTCIPAA